MLTPLLGNPLGVLPVIPKHQKYSFLINVLVLQSQITTRIPWHHIKGRFTAASTTITAGKIQFAQLLLIPQETFTHQATGLHHLEEFTLWQESHRLWILLLGISFKPRQRWEWRFSSGILILAVLPGPVKTHPSNLVEFPRSSSKILWENTWAGSGMAQPTFELGGKWPKCRALLNQHQGWIVPAAQSPLRTLAQHRIAAFPHSKGLFSMPKPHNKLISLENLPDRGFAFPRCSDPGGQGRSG